MKVQVQNQPATSKPPQPTSLVTQPKRDDDSRTRKMICFVEMAIAVSLMSADFVDNPYARRDFKQKGLAFIRAAEKVVQSYRHEFLKNVAKAPQFVDAHLDEMTDRGSVMYEISWIFAHLGTEMAEAFLAHLENFSRKLRKETENDCVCQRCGTQVYYEAASAMCATCGDKTQAITIEDYELARSIILDHGFRVSDEAMPPKGTDAYKRWMHEHMTLASDFIELVDSKRILGIKTKLFSTNS